MSQARFVLCDFCLDQFGTKAQPLIDAIENAADVAELQQALDDITAEVREHLKDQLPALMSQVRDINETSI
jgi:gas vesicle protein